MKENKTLLLTEFPYGMVVMFKLNALQSSVMNVDAVTIVKATLLDIS